MRAASAGTRSLSLQDAEEAAGDRVAAILAEAARRDLHTGWRLAALVFGAVQQAPDAVDGVALETPCHDVVDAEIEFNQTFENAVEDLVRRQAVLVGLVGPELGARRLGDDALGNDHAGRPQRA